MKVLLCAIVKNENRYLAEWVEYYKKLGFSKILLYDNNDPDGEVISDYGDFVEVIDYRGKHIHNETEEIALTNHGIQEEAYNDCYYNHCSGFDWVAYFDVDEYLYLDGVYDFMGEAEPNINLFLQQDKFIDDASIQINWETYGDDGKIYYEDKPVIERFTTPSKKQTTHVKTILRTHNPDFVSMRCHWADLKAGRTVYPNGHLTERGPKQSINYEGARIKHYFTKTIEEWIDRKYKQTSATGKDYLNDIKRRITEFFSYNDNTPEKMVLIGNKIDIDVDESKEKLPVIVSLTSYGKRFNNIPIVVRSIYKGTKLPQKIILNVFKDDVKDITPKIKELQESGLIDIEVFNENLKPHLKYYPTMLRYRNLPIVTIDDDVIYSLDLLESLYGEYLKHKDSVIARRAHKITFDSNGNWNDYDKWEKSINRDECSGEICATGVGGVLYPPDILKLNEDDKTLIREFLLTDDLYLRYLETIKGINVCCFKNTANHGLMSLDTIDKENRLYEQNVINHNNDNMITKINNLIYGEIY